MKEARQRSTGKCPGSGVCSQSRETPGQDECRSRKGPKVACIKAREGGGGLPQPLLLPGRRDQPTPLSATKDGVGGGVNQKCLRVSGQRRRAPPRAELKYAGACHKKVRAVDAN